MAARHERSPCKENPSIAKPVTTVRPAEFERNAGVLSLQSGYALPARYHPRALILIVARFSPCLSPGKLPAAGYDVTSTDLVDRGFGTGGHDFLKSDKPLAKHIITNPPYGTHGLGDAFVRRALIHARKTGGTVAMLLNLRSLANPNRHAKFVKTPPSAIYILDDLTCWPEGKPTSKTARIARQQYYWAVWKPGHKGAPKMWWLSTRDFK